VPSRGLLHPLQFFARSRYAAISGNTRQYADAGRFPCRVLPPDSSPVAAYSPARAAQNRVTAPRVWSSPERFRGSLSWPRARSLASRAFRFNCQRTVRKKIYASICVDMRRKATVSDATRRILTPRMPFLAHSGASNRPKATLSALENFGPWTLGFGLGASPRARHLVLTIQPFNLLTFHRWVQASPAHSSYFRLFLHWCFLLLTAHRLRLTGSRLGPHARA
jgi:hypothetical protein